MERAVAFFVVVILCCGPLVLVLMNTRRILSPPAMFSFGALILMLPQYYIVALQPFRVGDSPYYFYTALVILCTMALYIGHYSPKRSKYRNVKYLKKRITLDEKKLFKLGLAVGGAGLLGAILLGPTDEIREWRGLPVYLYTLSKLVYPGLALVIFSFFKRPAKFKLAVALVLMTVPLYQIVFLGRRSAILGLPTLLFFAFMFFKPKFKVGRIPLVAAAVTALVAVYAIPFWRESFANAGHLEAIAETPMQAIIDAYFDPRNLKTLETVDSMHLAYAYYASGYSEWGIGIYNQLIQNYVPGSLLGADFKEALMIGGRADMGAVAKEAGFEIAFYTGKSGFTDLYGQFSFLTPLAFFLIGVYFRSIYDRMVYFRDEGAALILTVFVVIPATLSWSQLTVNLAVELPKMVVIAVALTYCATQKHNMPSRSSRPQLHLQKVRV